MPPLIIGDGHRGFQGGVGIADAKSNPTVHQRNPKVIRRNGHFAVHESVPFIPLASRASASRVFSQKAMVKLVAAPTTHGIWM